MKRKSKGKGKGLMQKGSGMIYDNDIIGQGVKAMGGGGKIDKMGGGVIEKGHKQIMGSSLDLGGAKMIGKGKKGDISFGYL